MELWKRTLAIKLKNMSDLELARFMTDNTSCYECPFYSKCCSPSEIDMKPSYCDDLWLQHMHEEVKNDNPLHDYEV